MTDHQKEFLLQQQLKFIQQELGISKDDRQADAEEFSDRLQRLVVPDHVQKRVDDELQKLQVLEPSSVEYGVTRNYLDLEHARLILDRDHDGWMMLRRGLSNFWRLVHIEGRLQVQYCYW